MAQSKDQEFRAKSYQTVELIGWSASVLIGYVQSSKWAADTERGHQVLSRLHAMYTLRTSDGHNILVKADGIFKEGPGGNFDPSADMTATQDQVEYFTHIRFEAPGNSPYDWMNDVVAIGVMTMFEGKPIIDCYSLTNFPDFEASL